MKKLLILLAICFCFPFVSNACTSIIISGKATPDGRPLMWKHRDTGAPYNYIGYFDNGRYAYIGLVNSDDKDGAIWTGTNETGFSIMNTASYNLKDDNVKEMDREGYFMRDALKVCKTLGDFEHYLDTLSRPMRVEANFGVIDAYGGAAYYETNNQRYYKKDVNDPNLAPDGYMIYTNFSFEGRKDEGKGYVRYETAKKIFKEMKKEEFTPQGIFQKASRSFYNSLLEIDLEDPNCDANQHSGWFVEQDFIPRLESTASIVIQGVKKGMNPELTTMWTVLGYPPTSVAVPLWVKMGKEQCNLVNYNKKYKTAPVDWCSSELKNKIYSIKRGNGHKYLHWQLLWNKEQTGYMQKLAPVEEEVFALFNAHKKEWEKKDHLDIPKIRHLYKEAEEKIMTAFAEWVQSPSSF